VKITKQQPAIIFIMITLLMSLILSSIAFADNNEKPIIHGDPNEPSLTIHKKQLDPRDEWDDNSDGSEEGTGSGMLGQNTNVNHC